MTGKIFMRRNPASVWEAYDPFGRRIDTTGSTTSGLQEAISYAVKQGYELELVGGSYDAAWADRAVITCSSLILVPPLERARWVIGAVTVEFTPGVTDDRLVFDSLIHLHIEFHGLIIYRGRGAAMHLI